MSRGYKEHMVTTHNFILSGKYQIIKPLGKGASSQVYLARHISLEADRAIKVIPKTSSTCLNIVYEAQLLKALRHPGIPIIYDIEEDDDFFYLVEEYIQGESLEVFLLHQKFISRNLFYTFCRQICDIFVYLHTRPGTPVIYQDLKPEHIIVCGFQIKLIDFGASSYVSNSGNNFLHFGNLDFTAPECFKGGQLSVTSDVYSIGKIMEFISQYVNEPLSQNVKQIFQKSTAEDPKLRFETVEDLRIALQQEFIINNPSHLVKKIAVVGASFGCGTTHIAISLVSTMNSLGINAYYREENCSDHLRTMLPFIKPGMQPDGAIYYKNFKGFPKYGPGMEFSCPEDSIQVLDLGQDANHPCLSTCDLILLVCPGGLWNRDNAIQQRNLLTSYSVPLQLVCNSGFRDHARFLTKISGSPTLVFMPDEDAFGITPEKTAFTLQLLNEKGRKQSFFKRVKKRHQL